MLTIYLIYILFTKERNCGGRGRRLEDYMCNIYYLLQWIKINLQTIY